MEQNEEYIEVSKKWEKLTHRIICETYELEEYVFCNYKNTGRYHKYHELLYKLDKLLTSSKKMWRFVNEKTDLTDEDKIEGYKFVYNDVEEDNNKLWCDYQFRDMEMPYRDVKEWEKYKLPTFAKDLEQKEWYWHYNYRRDFVMEGKIGKNF
jgi:hypothetical protein